MNKTKDDKPFELELVNQLDPARDLQRLHSLIIGHMQSVEKFFDSTSGNTEESMMCRKTIQKVTEFAMHLEQIHRKYKHHLVRDTKYGSQHHPIGDDNYLRGGLSLQIAQQLNATTNASNQGNLFLNSGSATTPRVSATNHFDISPGMFQRGCYLRSSDNDRFSHF